MTTQHAALLFPAALVLLAVSFPGFERQVSGSPGRSWYHLPGQSSVLLFTAGCLLAPLSLVLTVVLALLGK